MVRSNDQVVWTIHNNLVLINPESGESYTGGVLEIRAELPATVVNPAGGEPYVKWDTAAMTWFENRAVSADGRIFTAKYTLAKDKTTVPGTQEIQLILRVLGAPNGLELKPTFTINLAGNEESRKAVLVDENTITVSAAPALNIQIMRNTALNYRSTFDFGNDKKVLGLMQGYGITLQLYNINTNKKLKGLEIPKGDITFDIEFNELKGSTEPLENITNQEEYMPEMWDYREATGLGNGKNGRNMKWNNDPYTADVYGCAPKNTGNTAIACYNGGTWSIIKDNNNENLYHITVSNYKFNFESNYPVRNPYGGGQYGADYGIKCFSSGYVQTILQFPESSRGNVWMRAEVSNIKYTSISGIEKSAEVKTNDNIVSTQLNTTPPTTGSGSFMKNIGFGNSYGYNMYAGDSNVPRGYSGGTIWSTFTVDKNNTEDYWVYGADYLVKIDDEAIEIKTYANGNECDQPNALNILYAGKQDKTGWNSDEEMRITTMDDLVYFDTLEEINAAGYVVVGFLAESKSMVGRNNTTFVFKVPYKAKETAQIGKVYQVLNDVRLYNRHNIPDRSYQTHLNTEEYENPEFIWRGERWNYTKSTYSATGQFKNGSGSRYGNSLLIIGARQGISITPINEQGQTKTNYNLGNNENIATFKIKTTLTNIINQTSFSGISLKITTTIPKGLTYIPGTMMQGDRILDVQEMKNANGTTTLVIYVYNCTVNQNIEEIRFKTNIDETTANGKQYQVSTLIAEHVSAGEPYQIVNYNPERGRTASTNIQITNLASFGLYKKVEEQVIENNGDITYRIVANNKDTVDLGEFQLLDILPYNEDGRGTNYSGTYSVEKITIANKNSAGDNLNNEFKLYITEDTQVRNGITVKDENLGTTEIWEEITSGEAINKEITGIAITGNLAGNTYLEVIIEIKTDGNKPEDKYSNNTTVQTSKNVNIVQSPIVYAEVIKRYLDGKVWIDKNKNGVIDEEEDFLEDIKVILVKEDETPAIDINNNIIEPVHTNGEGYYKFEDMVRGNYKIKMEYPTKYNLTQKEVGSNVEINSKLNENNETDEITKLSTSNAPLTRQEYLNAGLTIRQGRVIVHHYIINPDGTKTTNKVLLATGEQAESVEKEDDIGEEYSTSPVEPIEYYEYVEDSGNTSGVYTLESEETPIEVIYYYRLKKCEYTVNYYDKITGRKIKESKNVGDQDYQKEIQTADEIVEIENYEYDSADKESIILGVKKEENVINLYYIRKRGTVITKYKDIDTEREIEDSIKTEDGVGKDYKTDKKEIPGYVYVKNSNNTEGKYKEEETEVIYYYRKQEFNLKIDKWIDSIIINKIRQKGNTYETKDKVVKTDINTNKISEVDVKVVYKIRITNNSEVSGKVELLTEKIPEGFKFYQEDNTITWKEENGLLITEDLKDTEIEPGKHAEIIITLRWENNGENFGTKTNLVAISKSNNVFEYEEKNMDDNKDQAEFVISIVTGADTIDKIITNRLAILLTVMTILIGVIIGLKKK